MVRKPRLHSPGGVYHVLVRGNGGQDIFFDDDDLYRLTQASGTYDFMPGKRRSYALEMAYDTIHNITVKQQSDLITQPSGTPITQKKTSYVFAYAYGAKPHAPTHIGDRAYTYDANGNQTGWTHDQNGTRRTIVWDEENRIQSLFDNGHEKTYKYDDQGQRIIKRGPQGETVYVNQFFTSRPGATGTKHIYAGTSRIASKLMRQNAPNANPAGKTPFEKDLYFYHPDHLGTSNYITDLNAKLYEHLEYFPFGEAWVEENSNTQRTPYLFTAKELDEETGLYYFGARYYDPRTSVWQSADPALNRYIEGMGSGDGVFTPPNINLYGYVHQRPLGAIDPNGKACISAYFSNYCRRSRLYRNYDSVISSETRFFAAASLTTNMLGSLSGGGEGVASIFGFGITGETEDRMKEISALLEPLNTRVFNRIREGQENIRGVDLDRKLVNTEQTAVQGYLVKLKETDPEAYERFVSEASNTLNPSSFERGVIRGFSSRDSIYLDVLDSVSSGLKRPLDFANQSDREAIGNVLIDQVRKNGMPE